MQLFGTSLLALVVVTGCGACYFPIELQGHFLMQSTASADVQYSPVSINAEAIPIWGHCHRRIGDDVILMDSSGGANCIRCFQVRLRSRNVLQVHTEGLDKCYTSEDAAEASCPGENSKEILLYKTMDHNEEPIVPEYCPFNGRFTFTYNTNDASEGSLECPVPMSELDTCPSGSFLNLRYHGCSFEDYNVTYQCLGHWEGPSNQTYLALLHPGRHQYHCALFRENPDGSILLAFSSDSTCRSDLRSATSGYEMFSLAPVKQKEWPVIARDTICRFPKSIQGNWQHVTVHDNTFIYKDFSSMKTYTAKCIDVPPPPDKYPVYARSQCGEEMYSCLWIKSRGINVMEYQVGQQSSPTYKNSLCAESNFKDKSWTTQGKMERVQEMACPILGEYVGYIPDIMGLCAKLSSDCKSPEIMYYTVSNCTAPDIYEEREYRCLGQWEEDGLMFTFTQRRDVGTYECFVGTITSTDEIYIQEAGDNCQRNMNPLHHGMKLSKTGSCFSGQPNPTYHTYQTTSRTTNRYTPEPTKPWKPITAPPKTYNGNSLASLPGITVIISIPLVLVILETIM